MKALLPAMLLFATVFGTLLSCSRNRATNGVDGVIYYVSFDTYTLFPLAEKDIVKVWQYRVSIRSCADRCRSLGKLLNNVSNSSGRYDGNFVRFSMESLLLGNHVIDIAGNVKDGGMVDVVEFSKALDALMASKEVDVEMASENLLTPSERLKSPLKP